MKVFITEGTTLLPNGLDIKKKIDPSLSGYAKKRDKFFIENKISEDDYKLNYTDKTIRRISNHQFRWLLHCGTLTWNEYEQSQTYLPEDRGLFLGLGTSDADNNITPVGFSEKDKDDYISTAMVNMQPTIGLTLLNTTSASQIAAILNIQGDNAFFSPHSDAGANALYEAFYSIRDQQSKIALCGGVSQKISPWYYLSYERILRERKCSNLTEASSFILLHKDEENASAYIENARRTVIYDQYQYNNFIENYIYKNDNIGTIIHTGPGSDRYNFSSITSNKCYIYIDDVFGYCGASSVFLAINYAIKQADVVKNSANSMNCSPSKQVLIINHGFQGTCMAMVLNFKEV